MILGDRNRFRGGDGTCELCRQEVEDIGHFILRCPGVRGARRAGLLEDMPVDFGCFRCGHYLKILKASSIFIFDTNMDIFITSIS